MTADCAELRVHFFTLTDTVASEHMYAERLQAACSDRPITFVDEWESADVVHLFEVNFFTRDALSAFEFPTLFRILWSDIPVVVSTDDLYFIDEPELTARPRLYGPNHRVQKWLYKHCDAVIAISHSVKEAIQPDVPETEVSVVHHGVDERYFEDGENADEPFVLHVSLASKRKNPDALREVADRLDSRFVIAGGGWKERIPEAVIDDTVEVTGYVPRDDLIDLHRKASVFYFPTLHEGFGLPITEAMAAGSAVVSTNVYSVPEVTGDAAILHEPTDVDAHLESLRGLLNDDGQRESLSAAARQRARKFTWENTARETEAVYRSVVEQ